MHSPLGIPSPTTLTATAQACGYTAFNFQQLNTNFPGGFNGVPVPPARIDPSPDLGNDDCEAYPFYYSLSELLAGKTCVEGIPIILNADKTPFPRRTLPHLYHVEF